MDMTSSSIKTRTTVDLHAPGEDQQLVNESSVNSPHTELGGYQFSDSLQRIWLQTIKPKSTTTIYSPAGQADHRYDTLLAGHSEHSNRARLWYPRCHGNLLDGPEYPAPITGFVYVHRPVNYRWIQPGGSRITQVVAKRSVALALRRWQSHCHLPIRQLEDYLVWRRGLWIEKAETK